MTRFILGTLCGMFLFHGVLQSQDLRIVDSLHVALENSKDEGRSLILRSLAVEYVDHNNEKALDIACEAERVAVSFGDSVSIVSSNRLKSQILSRLGRIEEVILIFETYYPIANRLNLKKESILIANVGGAGFTYRGQFDKALYCYFLSYKMAKTYNDSIFVAMILHNIGITYYKLKDYRKGLRYLERSLEIDESIGTVSYFLPLNMSLCFVYLNDFKKARSLLNRAAKICGTECSSQAKIHLAYASGSIYFGLKKYDSAEREFLSSYSKSIAMNNVRMQLDNIILLAEIYIKSNRLEKAVRFLEEGEQLSAEGVPFNMEMIKIHRKLADLYLSIQNFEKASLYQKKYITLRDSIYDEELTTSLMKIEAEFLESKNMETIAEQNEILVLKEQVISRQKRLNMVTGFLTMTILISFTFLLRNYRQKKFMNVLLERKVGERTIELELSRDALLRLIHEKDFQMQRLSVAITEAIYTITGLCSTGAREISEPYVHSYLGRIRKTIDRLKKDHEFMVH